MISTLPHLVCPIIPPPPTLSWASSKVDSSWQSGSAPAAKYLVQHRTQCCFPQLLGFEDDVRDRTIIFLNALYTIVGHYWKSLCLWGIMVNGVTREVPRPKAFGRGTSQGTPLTMIPSWLFHIMSFLQHPGLIKRYFFQPMTA